VEWDEGASDGMYQEGEEEYGASAGYIGHDGYRDRDIGHDGYRDVGHDGYRDYAEAGGLEAHRGGGANGRQGENDRIPRTLDQLLSAQQLSYDWDPADFDWGQDPGDSWAEYITVKTQMDA